MKLPVIATGRFASGTIRVKSFRSIKINTSATAQQRSFPFSTGLFYAAGDIGPSLTSVCIAFYWLFFLIEVAGIPKLTAGLIYGSGYLFSAIASFAAGYWLDKNIHSTGSRCKLVGVLGAGLAVSFAMIWLVPDIGNLKPLWYLGWSWLFHLLFAVAYLAYLSMATAISSLETERIVLNSFRFGGTMLLTLIVLGLHGLSEGKWAIEQRLLILGVIVALLGATGSILCGSGLQNRLKETAACNPDTGISIWQLLKSRALWWAMGGNLAVWFMVQTTMVLTIFLCATAKVSDALVLFTTQLCIIVAAIMCSSLARRHGQNRLMTTASLFWITGAFCWWQSTQPFLAAALLGLGLGIGTVLSWARVPEALDFLAREKQMRLDARAYALLTLFRDVVSAAVPVIVAAVLQSYVTGSPETGQVATAMLVTVGFCSTIILQLLKPLRPADA